MMTLKGDRVLPTMAGPAIYRIRVRGHLDETWANRLGGMKVVENLGSGASTETVLQGRLLDQAALRGVLNALYQLHLPVISAQFLAEDDSEGERV